jgi:MFS family permease
MAPFAGKLADRFNSRIVATLGCSGVALGLVVLNFLNMQSDAEQVGWGLLIVGIGFGLFSTPNNKAIMSAVSPDNVGVASAAMNLGRTLGNLVGMSLVNVMVIYFIGDAIISELVKNELMLTVSMALKMSLLMVCLACIGSAMRGRNVTA